MWRFVSILCTYIMLLCSLANIRKFHRLSTISGYRGNYQKFHSIQFYYLQTEFTKAAMETIAFGQDKYCVCVYMYNIFCVWVCNVCASKFTYEHCLSVPLILSHLKLSKLISFYRSVTFAINTAKMLSKFFFLSFFYFFAFLYVVKSVQKMKWTNSLVSVYGLVWMHWATGNKIIVVTRAKTKRIT